MMKHSKLFIAGIFTSLFTTILAVYNPDYSDLEALGVTCSPRDTCAGNRSEQSFYRWNCECDSGCATYKDCCIDALYRSSSPDQNGNEQHGKTCLQFGESYLHKGVFVVSTCENTWNGSAEVRRKCEGQNGFGDPLNVAPVVDTQNRVAYRNRYCSECNNVPPSRLVSFLIELHCETLPLNATKSYVLSNLAFNDSLNKWGVNSGDSNQAANEFHGCDLIFNSENCLENSIRLCRPNMIATCPDTWRRRSIKRSCESYQAVVNGGNDDLYRNPHCALCNGLNVDRFNCLYDELRYRRRPMRFILRVDVNQSDGNGSRVNGSHIFTCPVDQKYDPFLKICRTFVSAVPNYQMVNGTCIMS